MIKERLAAEIADDRARKAGWAKTDAAVQGWWKTTQTEREKDLSAIDKAAVKARADAIAANKAESEAHLARIAQEDADKAEAALALAKS